MSCRVANKYAKADANERARNTLPWSTNLVSDKHYRLCPDGCCLVFMSRYNKGEHIDPAELEADWLDETPQAAEALLHAPVGVPLKPAVSVAQIMWARSMLDQFPRKTQEHIERENSVSWKQLQHWAHSSTEGLPERAPKKAPAPKAPVQKAVKAKAAPRAKAKEA